MDDFLFFDAARDEVDADMFAEADAREELGFLDSCGDDVSEFDGEDETEFDDEPWDGFRDDVEADADVLRNCGWGTDEDYGYYGDSDLGGEY